MDRTTEPIAICGMALRLPGSLKTPEEFWSFLTQKKDARARIPLQRFDAKAFHSPSGKSGYINSEYGYFLDESAEVGAIDASFFRMSQQESCRTDPQQKMLLELVRECFESAGETKWRGKDVGTFIGSFGNDWMEMSLKDSLSKSIYKITGHSDFMHANRLAYEYDLQGPSMTVRTACSASLLALHEACIAVQHGNCSAALVGGCNLLWSPDAMSDMAEQGVISLDSSCRTFDANADGYARGEAVNMIYIKPLSAAIRDGNPIRAIIRGTATNADGKTHGMSLPCSSSQEQMMRRAYKSAGITEAEISRTAFVECHGTGTPTGDPVEIAAVGNVFGNSGVYIGSVKPNVGHSEGASGITSVIKAVLALENRVIPPNIKFETPNPNIPFVEKDLRVPTECIQWPKDKLERVSVNSFGIGGANAHVILESVASYNSSQTRQLRTEQVGVTLEQDSTESLNSAKLVLVTANTSESLQTRVRNVRDYALRNHGHIDDVCYTLACRREHLPHRAFGVIQGTSVDSSSGVAFNGASSPRLAMIFTGQGAQWPRMGIELLLSNPKFASSIRSMDLDLKNLPSPPPWSIEEELAKDADSSQLNEAALSQPLCTAIQVALVDTLADLAITPDSVVGHSSGEIAAAYATGRISRREAIYIAYYRGVVSQAVPRGGSMAAIGLSWDETTPYLKEGITIACNNSPSNVTISGDKAIVEEVVEAVRTRNPHRFARMLRVDVAYHSHHMFAVGAEYENRMAFLRQDKHSKESGSARPDFFSSVTGELLAASVCTDARYFRSNLESPVLFLQAFDGLLAKYKGAPQHGVCLLEIGPHSALSGPIRQILTKNSLSYPYVSCLQREKHASATFLVALGTLWQHGADFDFDRLTNPSKTAKVRTNIPLYPWHHEGSHLLVNRIAQAWRYPKFPHHELLGSLILENAQDQPSFRNILQLEQIPWLRDHNIQGDVVFPCAAYVAMAGEASRRLCSSDNNNVFTGFSVKNMVIGTAILLEENKPIEIITSLRRWRITDTLESNGWEFTIYTYSGTNWIKHCSGLVEAVSSPSLPPNSSDKVLPRRTDAAKWYQAMWHVGARYGPFFQGLKNIACSPNEQIAQAIACDNTPKDCESKYLVHPTTIDIFFQATSIAACHGKGHALERLGLPTFIKQLDVYDCPGDLRVHTSAKALAHGRGHAWGHASDAKGSLAMNLDTLKVTPLDTEAENDPHAGGILTWNLEPSLTSMSTLVQQDPEAVKRSSITKEFTSLQIQTALERIGDIEPTSETMRKYVTWMKRQPLPKTSRPMETILLEARTCGYSIAKIMERITESIVELVTGKISPLEILTVDDSLTSAYQFGKFTDRTAYFKLLGHQKPNMRILEIGAGTGGTTREFLSSLINPSDQGRLWSTYTFTDISAGFFNAAKENFKDHPNLDFKVLDITKDPITQGFQAHSYDLVIATNVLHAVPNLQQALRNVRTLLQPNGTFYLEEICTETKAMNFVMGSLPGWWLGEQDGRPDEPYVDPERWNSELQAAGFSGIVDHMMDAPRPYHTTAYMIAVPAIKEDLTKPVALLFDDSSQRIAKDLEIELSQNGRFEVRLQNWDAGLSVPKMDVICLLDVNRPFFMDINASRFEKFRQLMIQISESRDGVLWLTRSSQIRCENPQWGRTPGAIRGIREEMGFEMAMCEIDRVNSVSWKAVTQIAQKFCSRGHIAKHKLELEYAIEQGKVYVPRMYPFSIEKELRKPARSSSSIEDVKLDLTIGAAGRLDTLQWVTRADKGPEESQVAVEIMATGLNFRDVLTAMDLLEVPRQILGLEAAGVVREIGSGVKDLEIGDRVIVMGGASLFTTKALVPSINCWKIPTSLSFQDAATMPCVFMTVIYGLLEVGQMQSGQTVLIHSACGGVGLAAIQVCRMLGATIYCTVSSEEKVRFLEQEIGISRRHIFDSRSRSFLADVMRATNGAGVDLVLNSLSGDLLHASWECVAKFGKMIEIGKRDLVANGHISLNPFAENRSFHGIELAHLFSHRPYECRRLLVKMVDLYESGHIQPIFPIKTFEMAEAEQCFRYMQQGRHIGKVILSMEGLVSRPATSSGLLTAHPKRKPHLNSHASYILAGGLGGLGRVVANWLVENGARHLIFLSRSAGERASEKDFFKELESQACTVTVVKGSVAIAKDVEKAIAAATAPIRGVMNFCMELQDMSFHQMTHAAWNAPSIPKVDGTWNLHNACIAREINLDFFLLFSSIVGVFGHAGQANYGSANTFLDAFVQYRHSIGLNASVINVGVMHDHGYVADNPLVMKRLQLQGFYGVRMPQLLDAITLSLDAFETKSTDGTSRICRSVTSIGVRNRTPLSDPANRTPFRNDRRMNYYRNIDAVSNASSAAIGLDSATDAIKIFINQVLAEPGILTQPGTADFLARQIAKKLAIMLLRPIKDKDDAEIDISSSLQDSGLDSLVAVEIRSWWRTTFGFEISVLQMLKAENMLALGERAAEGLKLKYSVIQETPVSPTLAGTVAP